ncbi:MAG: hypothetical protein ACI9V0_002954 [Parasphingorhabdus sp.]|jgi:hypothetical protein
MRVGIGVVASGELSFLHQRKHGGCMARSLDKIAKIKQIIMFALQSTCYLPVNS